MVEKEKERTGKEYQKWLSYDKTMTINEETKWTERDKHDFVNFCWYNRRLRKVRPGSTKINEDKNGEKYASIEVKRGDCPELIDDSKKAETQDWIENNIQTERNELRLDKENDFKFNEDFKYKFSFKIPENFPLSPTRLVIWQWKYNKIEGSSEKWDLSPMLAQRIQKIDWKYYFTITDWVKKKNILRKIPFNDIKGKWVNMDYELRFSDKKDENGNPIPCTVKLKANIEWERKIDEKKEFYLAEENNLQFNSEEPHSGYFKFWLYRDNYDYAKTKIKDKEGLNEIEQAQKTEEQNPMQIYFKNFSMENLDYKEREDERDEAKQKDWEQAEQKKSELLKDEQKNEFLPESNEIVRKGYLDAFLNLVWDDKELSKVIESLKNGSQMQLSLKDIENIYNKLNEVKYKSKKSFIDQELLAWTDKDKARDKFHDLAKFCMDPIAIKKYQAFNCSWASLMMASIIESLWWTAYITWVYHHVVCITEIWDRQYMIDTNNTRIEDITNKVKVEDTEYEYLKKLTAKWPLFKEYTQWYIFDSLQQAEKTIHAGNYESIDKIKYREVREKITELLTEEKIDSYPKKWESDYPPKFLLNDNYPEFDHKIYDIQDKQWKESSIIWKTKLKIQERLLRVKRRFSKK